MTDTRFYILKDEDGDVYGVIQCTEEDIRSATQDVENALDYFEDDPYDEAGKKLGLADGLSKAGLIYDLLLVRSAVALENTRVWNCGA